MEFEVTFYKKADGSYPAEDFIRTLEPKMRAKVLRLIQTLAALGIDLREPYSKPLGDGIFELRAQSGNNTARVLYFFVIGRRVVLTNGFVKKTQKTPRSEIDLAKKYRSDYLNKEVRK